MGNLSEYFIRKVRAIHLGITQTGNARKGHTYIHTYIHCAARGIFGMQRNRFDDLNDRVLVRKKNSSLLQVVNDFKFSFDDRFSQLEYNDLYAAALTRAAFLNIAEAIPDTNDADKMAQYWMKYWNQETDQAFKLEKHSRFAGDYRSAGLGK